MIEALGSIFILAVLTEAIVEYFIQNPNKEQPWLKYAAAGVGVLLCVAYKADLFSAVGVISSVPFLGSALTGIVVSRGSNYLNDFISKLRSMSGKE